MVMTAENARGTMKRYRQVGNVTPTKHSPRAWLHVDLGPVRDPEDPGAEVAV
jgi:hypothetical protein